MTANSTSGTSAVKRESSSPECRCSKKRGRLGEQPARRGRRAGPPSPAAPAAASSPPWRNCAVRLHRRHAHHQQRQHAAAALARRSVSARQRHRRAREHRAQQRPHQLRVRGGGRRGHAARRPAPASEQPPVGPQIAQEATVDVRRRGRGATAARTLSPLARQGASGLEARSPASPALRTDLPSHDGTFIAPAGCGGQLFGSHGTNNDRKRRCSARAVSRWSRTRSAAGCCG